jgi:hypothetical protein
VIELAHIFRIYGQAYLNKFGLKMPTFHLKAFRDIVRCRTRAMGGTTYFCEHCQTHHYSYHSCGNRNCNKCQNGLAEDWLEKSKERLLPVQYFLLTFTLPAELREYSRKMQKLIYSLLLKTAAEALQILAYDPKFVGGRLGILAILHTWRRDLAYHPHVHIVATGGGWDDDKFQWRPAKNNYLVPVKALSLIFRAKFRDALKEQCPDVFSQIHDQVWKKNWVVHSKSVGDGQNVLKYLAQYVFRPAISNNRIIKCSDGNVTFKYKDAKSKTWQFKMMPALNFISSYMQHVLPTGFVKVRYYGLYAHNNRTTLAMLKTLSSPNETVVDQPEQKPKKEKMMTCPTCGKPLLYIRDTRKGEQWINAPPEEPSALNSDFFVALWRMRKSCFS